MIQALNPDWTFAASHPQWIEESLLVLASGRNLWPVIIGDGLFDASRFVLFYFQGPPT
jgi:hypothetical protein